MCVRSITIMNYTVVIQALPSIHRGNVAIDIQTDVSARQVQLLCQVS